MKCCMCPTKFGTSLFAVVADVKDGGGFSVPVEPMYNVWKSKLIF